jgi:hypothetical protein
MGACVEASVLDNEALLVPGAAVVLQQVRQTPTFFSKKVWEALNNAEWLLPCLSTR